MLVTDIEVADSAHGARLSASVVGDHRRLKPTIIEFVYRDTPAHAVATPGDALAAALLAPAVVAGEELRIDAPVSGALVENMQKIVGIWRSWRRRWHPVHIDAPRADRSDLAPSEISAAFSGGVDSFYTALKPREEPIGTLITVLGILGGGLPSLEPLVPDLSRAARRMGKDYIAVDTNAFVYGRRVVPDSFHIGAVLAAPALGMGGRIRRHYIAAGPPLWRLYPSGTHPATDPLWSTEALDVVHDGATMTKSAKAFAIAHSDVALEHLNVCQARRSSPDNCRRCTKCQVTALVLQLAGTLDRCPTLGPVTPATLRRTELGIYIENFQELRDVVADRDMRRSIDYALRRARLRRRLRPVGRVLRRAQRALELARGG